MSAPLVEIRKLSLSLVGGAGPVNILREIDLSIAAGETLSIVGPSGAGKTTLLMALSGLERPSGGSVAVAGIELGELDEDGLARFRRRHVGIVFQSFHLVPSMTALENVALPLEFAGVADAAGRAREALEAVGLSGRLGHFPGELSGGEQQRVALARAFVPRPALLLADEPTGNLDRQTGERVMELLFALQREQGTTLVLVTHDERLAGRCQRRLTMADGRLL
jgi:putative ABC transport system ATP-binding protein